MLTRDKNHSFHKVLHQFPSYIYSAALSFIVIFTKLMKLCIMYADEEHVRQNVFSPKNYFRLLQTKVK